jgi:hypothetical protein
MTMQVSIATPQNFLSCAETFLSRKTSKDLLVQAAQYLPETLRGDIMTIAKQWKEEGRQEGEARVLQFQLQRRFSNLPSRYVKRIENADAQTLLHWAGEVLDAETLEDVFGEN